MRRTAPRLSKNHATPQYHGTVQPSKGGYVWTGKIGVASDAKFLEPLRVKKPAMWFVNSTSDLFHENVPDEVIDRVFAIMALCPQHTFQVLTKRPERMREYVSRADDAWHGNSDLFEERFGVAMDRNYAWIDDIYDMPWPLPNVWLGVSVEDQTRANERIPDLLATPAAIRFISAEPLLGSVDLTRIAIDHPNDDRIHISVCFSRRQAIRDAIKSPGALNWDQADASIMYPLDWAIVGGESGKGARPMHPDWARELRDQCAVAEVPFFFKQWGEWLPSSEGLETTFEKVGTKKTGRLLDGVEHNAMPELVK